MEIVNVHNTEFGLVVVEVNAVTRASIVAPAKFERVANGRETFSVLTPGKGAATLIVNDRRSRTFVVPKIILNSAR